MLTETLLTVKNLKKYFPIKSGVVFAKTVGQVKAVDGISFHVAKGETLGIVGESGCGKSTLGKTILRLEEPTEGEIWFKGTDIAKLKAGEMRKIRRSLQMIFQDPYASLNPRMTVGRMLAEPLLLHNIGSVQERENKVKELLEVVGLDAKHFNYYPHEFSGGQRQRIAIARALVCRPELIIADEAVSALDVSVQAQILNLLKELQEKFALTYIFISHNLPVIRYISDRIGVMYLGKMMELTAAEELFTNPLHPYTKGLLDASPRLDRRRKAAVSILGLDVPSAANPPDGCVFHTRCPYCKEICCREIPGLREIRPGHQAACHLLANKE